MNKNKLDTIGRDEIIENILSIIESVSLNKGNTTFAIDGDWGAGKTFILEKLENKLSEIQSEETADNRYFVIHYNSWKYDYYDEPLIAIVSAMINALDENKVINDSKLRSATKEVFKQIGVSLLDIGNGLFKKFTKVDLKEKISKATENTKEILNKTSETIKETNKYDVYFDFKNVLSQLKEGLNNLSKNYTIIFAVDELDRCLPEYAIKVLERLHHLTEDVDNIVTIVSIDKNKLKKSISNYFGYSEQETSIYLKKFIKFSVNIDKGISKDNIKDKYKDYLDLFENQLFKNDNIDFLKFFNILFTNIDVREQEILMEKIKLVHELVNNETCDKSLMYLEMIFAIIENYYQQDLINVFDGEKFMSFMIHSKNNTNLIKLNNVLKTKFNNFGLNTYFVNNENGNKGFILFVLSNIREENNTPKNFKIRPLNDYFDYNKQNVFNQLNKFREFMKIMSE